MDEGGRVMHLLAAGVPITLLLDLASPGGPDSRGILSGERVAGRAETASSRGVNRLGCGPGRRKRARAS